MGQISVTILAVAGSNLSGNQQFDALVKQGFKPRVVVT
jgi:hypothetical protein